MNNTFWSEEDKKFLKDNREKGSKWIAEKLGRSECSVNRMAGILKVSLKRTGYKRKGHPCPFKGEAAPRKKIDRKPALAMKTPDSAAQEQVKLMQSITWRLNDTQI